MSTETKKVDYHLLGRLHSLLQQLTEIGDRMRRGPIKIRLAETNRDGFVKVLEGKKEELLAARKEARAKQSQLDDREAKLADLQSKLNTAESNKEFQLIKDRIAADEQANSCQADEIFETLEKIDALEAEVQTATENMEKSQSELDAIDAKVTAELKELEIQESQIKEDLAQSEKQIHSDLKGPYRHVVKTKGEEALAETDLSTCGNCHQTIRPQVVSELKMQKAVICVGCGAILYRKTG